MCGFAVSKNLDLSSGQWNEEVWGHQAYNQQISDQDCNLMPSERAIGTLAVAAAAAAGAGISALIRYFSGNSKSRGDGEVAIFTNQCECRRVCGGSCLNIAQYQEHQSVSEMPPQWICNPNPPQTFLPIITH